MARSSRQSSFHLANQLLDVIRDARLEPGHHLREQQLADLVGVSRTPIRSALNLLAKRGIVETRRNHGYFLRKPFDSLHRIEIEVPSSADEPPVFKRSNLVAWCIVPFDAKNRGPAERAKMVKRLGFTKVAYDWRENHVPTFEEAILQYKKHGIEYFAFWGTHDKAFELFAKYDLHPQIWQTLAAPQAATQEERVAAAAKQMLPLAQGGRVFKPIREPYGYLKGTPILSTPAVRCPSGGRR